MTPTENVPALEIPVCWAPVLVNGKAFGWHEQKLNSRAKEQIAGPRVYRWVLRTHSGEVLVYIGQTENFEKRLRSYRRGAGEQIHSRVRTAIEQCKNGGGTVELYFLDLQTGAFRMFGRLIDRSSLNHHEVRIMMEGVAVLKALAGEEKLLNRYRRNAVETMMAQLLKPYPSEMRKDILEEVQRTLRNQSADAKQ
jgi:hypothetical protein